MGRRRGGDKLFQKKKELQKSDFQRKTNNKEKVNDIIIACEDAISAPAYLKKIVNDLISKKVITPDSFVIAEHNHTNPKGVLKDLKSYCDENGKTYKDFKHKWIVIDRDKERVNGGGHSPQDFNIAIQNAKSKKSNLNVNVAYSNDSFELWYLLHFDYLTTPFTRDEILERLINKLKSIEPYKFSQLNKDNIKQENYTNLIYDILLSHQGKAILNAENLLLSYGSNVNPEEDNPSTTLHQLVKVLNTLDK